jgi:WD40 repeat protein
MLQLLEDMSRFALRNCYIIDKVPMQIYMSSLLFAPANSITRRIFGHTLEKHFGLMPCMPHSWGMERQKLEGHKDNVTTVAFSPDGRIVVSGYGILLLARRGRNLKGMTTVSAL